MDRSTLCIKLLVATTCLALLMVTANAEELPQSLNHEAERTLGDKHPVMTLQDGAKHPVKTKERMTVAQYGGRGMGGGGFGGGGRGRMGGMGMGRMGMGRMGGRGGMGGRG